MKKKWNLKQNVDTESVKRLSQELGINEKLSALLVQRDIFTYDKAKEFFRPSLNNLHDPFLMKDMDKAVDRIDKAIDNGEKVLIYGDYDVDGTTAVSLVFNYFKDFHHKIDFYIPDRYDEGYGISFKGIEFAKENNFTLIIALDCGIKAIDKIEFAKNLGIDFIICDHHRPGETIPKAVAVLDPKREDCTYPYDDLSGCGVGFKLIHAYSKRNDIRDEELYKFLDLVVVSIAADIVKITGENRILAYYGLYYINNHPCPGLETILKYANIVRIKDSDNKINGTIFNRKLNINDLVFLIGPRINAAGRIDKADNSVKLLLSESCENADKYAKSIQDTNEKRKDLDFQVTEEAVKSIADNKEYLNEKSTIVYNENWHKGVLGIVASRLTETFYRPTIVLTKSNGLITGSARSVKNFDIYNAINHCSDLLEHFGGHKYAAGLSVKPEKFEAFKVKFNAFVQDNITNDQLVPDIDIDLEIDFEDITPSFFNVLNQFAPFGPGNMMPVFLTKDVKDRGYGKTVGKDNLHLKIDVNQYLKSNVFFSGIGFKLGQHYPLIKSGNSFDVCYHIDENEWKGRKNLQLLIKDIRPREEDDYPYTSINQNL